MRPGDSYDPTGFFGGFCNSISSCLSLLCCCWLFRNCLGRQREPATPLMAPPQGSMDDGFEQLTGPHSPFGASKPPRPAGPIHDRRGRLLGPHIPFGASNPPGHSPFGASNPTGPPDPFEHHLGHLGGPHSPFGPPNAPSPPGQHGPQHGSLTHPGPLHSHGPPGLPGPPPGVPGVQPGLL